MTAGLAVAAVLTTVGCAAPSAKPVVAKPAVVKPVAVKPTAEARPAEPCGSDAAGVVQAHFDQPCTVEVPSGSFRITLERPVTYVGYDFGDQPGLADLVPDVWYAGLPVRIDEVRGRVTLSARDLWMWPTGVTGVFSSMDTQDEVLASRTCVGRPAAELSGGVSVKDGALVGTLKAGDHAVACLPTSVYRPRLPQSTTMVIGDRAHHPVEVSWPALTPKASTLVPFGPFGPPSS